MSAMLISKELKYGMR